MLRVLSGLLTRIWGDEFHLRANVQPNMLFIRPCLLLIIYFQSFFPSAYLDRWYFFVNIPRYIAFSRLFVWYRNCVRKKRCLKSSASRTMLYRKGPFINKSVRFYFYEWYYYYTYFVNVYNRKKNRIHHHIPYTFRMYRSKIPIQSVLHSDIYWKS